MRFSSRLVSLTERKVFADCIWKGNKEKGGIILIQCLTVSPAYQLISFGILGRIIPIKYSELKGIVSQEFWNKRTLVICESQDDISFWPQM